MKYGFGLFLVCIVTAAGLAVWLLGIDPIHSFRSANGFVRQEPQPSPAASLDPNAKQASKPTRPRIPQTRAVIEPATTQEAPTLAPIAAADQIPTATHKETIANTDGDPALSISRVDHGHERESLVYTRDRGRELTIVSLEDGKVSSAPPAPSPILKASNDTPTEMPAAPKPPAKPSPKANLGTCGEYRDGKLIVKPCSQVPLSPSEWLAKGSGATAIESDAAKRK